jgi:ATP-dependent DNA helicase RecQ
MNETTDARLIEVLARHWGYASLRPLQAEAMEAALRGRDTIVVMPTGGGKSLCYQVPAIVRGSLSVVVSPLISLMKDQVDGLVACGVAAAQLNSSQSGAQQRAVERALVDGNLRLLFVSPERLALSSFRQLLGRAGVDSFAIDEAHCISQWGHDFRPEYRQLCDLRQLFPKASLHAYTATATERVRRDIIEQLALRDPVELVGNFDRPNLTYRIVPRRDEVAQVEEVIQRHRAEAGIIYCIRRRDVDALASVLARRGHRVAPYHAGLSPELRRSAQEAFSKESCDIIVATVAFGMGIDRSNVRFVLHTGMPKSIEHYQQESGRAGRDGLEAECTMLYSPSDAAAWSSILSGGASDPSGAIENVARMQRYAEALVCRHKALVEYFGQTYENGPCGACDVCLDHHDLVPDSLVIAQKIVSCVVRARESFGVGHIVAILRGANSDKLREWRHDKLSTFGILGSFSKEELTGWIAQLVSQRFLERTGGLYPVLRLTPASRSLLRGTCEVQLTRVVAHEGGMDDRAWRGVDHALFEELREWRRGEADSRGVPPFVILGDTTLRHLAAVRPSSLDRMHAISGIGENRLSTLGSALLAVIDDYCTRSGATRDAPAPPAVPWRQPKTVAPGRIQAFNAFRRGAPIDDVVRLTGRARSTVAGYLADFIITERPGTIDRWVDHDHYEAITPVAARLGTDRLKPIYDEFEGRMTYDDIRLVVAHLVANGGTGPPPFA